MNSESLNLYENSENNMQMKSIKNDINRNKIGVEDANVENYQTEPFNSG